MVVLPWGNQKPGPLNHFLTEGRHGETVRSSVVAIAILLSLVAGSATAHPTARTADCSRTSVGLTPLTDLKTGRHLGFRGGLYPGGRNAPSARYLKKGLASARRVAPLGPDGRPARDGAIVLLSIGMSNTTQEFSVFKRLGDADPRKSPRVAIVDGAQGGQDAVRISDPQAPFWANIDNRLRASGVTRLQVQAAWVKQAIAGPREPFPADARRLQGALRNIVGILRSRFPNLRLVYFSSRIYAGYASTSLNPEPYAYQSAFAVKWTVQDRIEGKLRGPWLGWGPYLWADGTKGRGDGHVWTCEDLGSDGTHPSRSGAEKVASLLLRFFTSNRTTRTWFVGS